MAKFYQMTKISRPSAWIMLCLAIALEILGLSLLQVFEERPTLSKVILLAFMNASYFLMSLALRQISVGVAYAAWEIIGGIGVLFVSFIFFDPILSTQQYFGVVLGFIGIVCIILGEKHTDEKANLTPNSAQKD